ncbi:hypothetical protein H8B09_11345 [Paenibacillus sp. PR3]|uniref:Uncharacterized protein n=1 Tax=Paenibacillus terricola TaxID=2763503 RepID=A0ABR8MVR1_9BACL|nr:hypothetical protein [Paenibacillus terricola]MBD3919351.1 hypothetical protein [Paenibacillus terricola]
MKYQIENYYRDMNQSLDPIIQYWNTHQLELNKLYQSAKIFNGDLNNVLVIGVGNAYDLPLKEIVSDYFSIDLLDIDKETLLETSQNICNPDKRKINLLNRDVVGISIDKIEEIIGYLRLDKERAKSLLERLILEKQFCFTNILNNNYSLVISSTVSSQLILPMIDLIEQTGDDELIILAKRLGDLVAEKHVEQIWSLLEKTNGTAIITSEQYAWGYYPNGTALPLTSFIKEPSLMLDKNLQLKLNQLGGGLTINGRITSDMLEKHIPERNTILRKQWVWKFSENIYYLVKGWVISK